MTDPIYGHIYAFYFWAGVPILIATGTVLVFLRPIYLIALCVIYSHHLDSQHEVPSLPQAPSRGLSALVAFVVLCVLLGTVYLFRYQSGIMKVLATPYPR